MRKDQLIKFAALVIAVVVVVVAGAKLSAQTGSTLLFKSGFENDTTLGGVSGNAPNSIDQTISGTDQSTGFAWSSLWSLWSPNHGLVGLHLVPYSGSSDPLASHFFNAIDTATSHSGSRSLLMKVDGYPEGSCCAQDVLNSVGMSQPVTQLYERVWMKFQPELATYLSNYTNNYWRVLFEFKTQTDYRIATYVYGDGSGNAYFHVHADNNAASGCRSCTTYWSISNHAVTVPLNQWFLLEIYLKRSAGSDGRFFWAVNGQTVADRTGANYGPNNEQIVGLFFQNLYSNYFPMYQWLDDFELWDSPPCTTLPCGSGGSNSTSSPQPPTNVTSTVH